MALLFSIIRKEFQHLLRDLWSFAIVTVGAVLLLVLLAGTFSIETTNVPVVAWDMDKSSQSRAYLNSIHVDDFFDIRFYAGSESDVEKMIVSGRAKVGIIIPPEFGSRVERVQPVAVQVIIDGTAPNEAIRAKRYVEAHTMNYAAYYATNVFQRQGMLATAPVSPLELHMHTLYNPGLRMVNGILPGLMAIVLTMPSLSAAVALAREKEQGTLEALVVVPVTRWQFILGKLVPYIVIGLLDTWLFTLIGVTGFAIPFQGAWFDLFILATTFLIGNLGIALLIASLVNTQQAATIVAFIFFVLPSFFLSGFYFPRFNMPEWLQNATYFLPATHFVTIARGVMLKGIGIETLWVNGVYLTLIGLAGLGLASRRLLRKIG